MKIYSIRLGITLGIIWGVSVILLAFISSNTYEPLFFKIISDIYVGCGRKNIFTKFMCGLLGFGDAFIGGVLIGLLYNYIPIKI